MTNGDPESTTNGDAESMTDGDAMPSGSSNSEREALRPVVDGRRSAELRATESITRVDRSKREAIEWYDRLSPWYDSLVARFESRPRRRGIELLAARSGEHVLDVGAGTGIALASFAADVGRDGRVVGLDASGGMCGVARDRLIDARVSNRAHVVRGDAEGMPFDDGSFDALFSSFTLELFDTPMIGPVLAEFDRVIRADGRIVIVSLSKRDAGIATRTYELVHELAPRYVDCRPIYVQELLDEFGFDVVEAETLPLFGMTVEIVLVRP